MGEKSKAVRFPRLLPGGLRHVDEALSMKPRRYFLLLFVLEVACAVCASAVTVRPENTDEILVNPDMGLVMYHYSNRQWAYGQLQERGDTLDWFPGTGCVYFRLPWCLLEPEEGVYRWDLFDSYAAPWVAASKQVGFRLTCCESRYAYATPEWVRKAGAKGWFFKMKMFKVFGREPPGEDLEIWEPDYGDPVFLAKLENFLKAFARRYDGKPYVAFVDVGTVGMWGEGHTRAYAREMKAAGKDPEAAFHRHYELHRRLLPNTTLLCVDDQAGATNPKPAAEVPLMRHARDLGFGFRDDSILVYTPSMLPESLRAHPWWFHADWAQYFAPVAPTFVEHEHYDLAVELGAWDDRKLVESVEAYRASWLSVHGWPKACFDGSKDAYARAARRLGYRFELREATFPDEVEIGAPVEIASTWVNVGVARRYKGATLAWTLLDGQGRVAWVSADASYDFTDAEPKLNGVERPVVRKSRCTFGFAGEIPQANDGVWVYTQMKGVGNFATDTRVPTLAPGAYTLAVSLGDRDGTPRLALPLKGGVARRYPVGTIRLVRRPEPSEAERQIVAAKAEGRRECVIRGEHQITSTIDLPSNFTLRLEDAHLTLAPGTFCNMFRAVNVTNVAIVGSGRAVVDGGEYNGLSEKNAGRDGRPPIWVNNLVLFANVRGFRVEGLHVTRQRWWALNFIGCSQGTVRAIDFRSHHQSVRADGTRIDTVSRNNYRSIVVKNSDGIDVRAGCHDILIEDITGFCEDDSVALTCLSGRLERRFLPEGADYAIRDVTVRNVRTSSMCSNVRLLAQGGGKLQRIVVEDVEDVSDGRTYMTGRGEAGVNLGDTRLYGKTPAARGDVSDIVIRNVRSRAPVGVWLRGRATDVTVENVRGFDGNVHAVLDAHDP